MLVDATEGLGRQNAHLDLDLVVDIVPHLFNDITSICEPVADAHADGTSYVT